MKQKILIDIPERILNQMPPYMVLSIIEIVSWLDDNIKTVRTKSIEQEADEAVIELLK